MPTRQASGERLGHNGPLCSDAGEPLVQAAMEVGEFVVVQPEQVQEMSKAFESQCLIDAASN